MNLLGLFLAASLRRNLLERGRACDLRGALTIDAGGMPASIRFEEDGVTVTRAETPARVTIRAPLHVLLGALTRPRPGNLLRVRLRGSPRFAWRALRYLKP